MHCFLTNCRSALASLASLGITVLLPACGGSHYVDLPSQVQTIGFLSYLHYAINEEARKPYLILGPLSTLPNWMSEFKRWCPLMKAIMYHGDKEKRAELRASDLAPGACHRGNGRD